MDSFVLQLPQDQLGLQLIQLLKKMESSEEKEKGGKAD